MWCEFTTREHEKYYTCTKMRDDRKMYHQRDISHQQTADALLTVAHVDWLIHHTHTVQTIYSANGTC